MEEVQRINAASAYAGQKEQDTPMQERLLTQDKIKAAEAVLAKGYCVELRPVKGGDVKVIQVIRQQVTEKSNKAPSP